jgi:hypothetical protein
MNLSHNRIRDGGAASLAESPHLCRLAELDLTGNLISDEGAQALAASPHMSRLVSLILRRNPILDPGAMALVRSTCLTSLRRLDLGVYRRTYGDEVAAAYLERFGTTLG